MLRNIRKIADSLVIRIFLGIIVLSFVIFGIKDVVQTQNDVDLVTFSEAKNITEHEFLKAKSEEVSAIQKQNGINLTEEDIKLLNIDDIVIRQLINDHILRFLSSYYDLDISEDTVIQLVKKSNIFNNDKGEFDAKIFRSAFKNSYNGEGEYLNSVRNSTLKNSLIKTFTETLFVPNSMVQNVVNHMSEIRSCDIVQIDLDTRDPSIKIPVPTEAELLECYKDNKDYFKIPETRSFSYIVIPKQLIEKTISVSNEEAINFYNENSADFNKIGFNRAKNEVITEIRRQKFELSFNDLVKELEDEVGAGTTLKELSEKHNVILQNIDNNTIEQITSSKNFGEEVANSLFDSAEGEVIYPTRLKDDIFIAQLTSVKNSTIPEFASIKKEVENLWQLQHIRNMNMKKIKELADKYDPKTSESIFGINIDRNFTIAKNKANRLPQELVQAIFYSKIGSKTPVFIENNKAYFAFIKNVMVDKIVASNIEKKSKENIILNIKNGVTDELITYIARKNNMKIKNPTK